MSLSFIHRGTSTNASYRYRAARPAEALGVPLNDETADLLIFAKPHPTELPLLRQAKQEGRLTVVDCCDVHWHKPSVKAMMEEADALTANTAYMAQMIYDCFQRTATVIDDPFEWDECPPHCAGNHLLWYGHPHNADSFNRIATFMEGFPHRIVTLRASIRGNAPTAAVVEWSPENLRREFATADMVLIPETAPYKSANRTCEAIRQGCFVVAEPHPSLVGFPGIWIGNIKEGVAWTLSHFSDARERTFLAQQYVAKRYSPERMVNAWKSLLTDLASTSGAAKSIGTAGSMSMPSAD